LLAKIGNCRHGSVIGRESPRRPGDVRELPCILRRVGGPAEGGGDCRPALGGQEVGGEGDIAPDAPEERA
jgi:hypothetical protein